MQQEVARKWITYKEAEELVGLSRKTLWKLLCSGEVSGRKIGRAVRIDRESLEEYMEQGAESFGE